MFKIKNYVTFLSPGTFFSEVSSFEIDSWDIKDALVKGKAVLERYNAKPYGFYFSELSCADDLDDGNGNKLKVNPKELKRSGTYFITGKVSTIEDIMARSGDNDILISNMRCNDYTFIVENFNSYRSTLPFNEGDYVIDLDGEIVDSYEKPERAKYKKKSDERRKRYLDGIIGYEDFYKIDYHEV